jgi:hypothetical protein
MLRDVDDDMVESDMIGIDESNMVFNDDDVPRSSQAAK